MGSEAGAFLRTKNHVAKVLFVFYSTTPQVTSCSCTRKLKYHELMLLVFPLIGKFLQNLHQNNGKERRKEEFRLRELGCYGVETHVIPLRLSYASYHLPYPRVHTSSSLFLELQVPRSKVPKYAKLGTESPGLKRW